MKLKDAYRWLAMKSKFFCQLKEDTRPLNDPSFISVVHMRQGNRMVMTRDQQEVNKFLKDDSVVKRYLTSEIKDDDLKILALAYLGTKYLHIQCNLEDYEEGNKVLLEAIERKAIELSRE